MDPHQINNQITADPALTKTAPDNGGSTLISPLNSPTDRPPLYKKLLPRAIIAAITVNPLLGAVVSFMGEGEESLLVQDIRNYLNIGILFAFIVAIISIVRNRNAKS
jgi:hypothetical protein